MNQLNAGLRQYFPTAFWSGNPTRREIALTFDDGPNAQDTPALLALLDEYAVKATFLHIGVRAAAAPDLVRQVVDAGHQIGLHGYEHHSFLLKSEEKLRAELAKAQNVIADATQRDPTDFYAVRPPFGHFTPAILTTLISAGYLPLMWSLVPFHWLQGADATIKQVLEGVHNGTILVLHEGLPGPAVTDLTKAVLPRLIEDGYHFVTIHEMRNSLQQDT